jgi:Spy/CpxP family protein refolding chaperone
MKQTLLQFALVLALAISPGLAQNSANAPGPANRVQHRLSFLTTLLDLTSAQQQQATTIFTASANTEAGLRSNMQTARQSLTAAIRNNDVGTIDQLSNTIGALTAQMTSAQAKADAAFYQILTPDQQAKLAQYDSQKRPYGRGMRPGGFRP